MNKNWKKVCATVVGFFGIGAHTACYGMPPNDNDSFVIYGKVSSTDNNGDTKQVSNIDVVIKLGNDVYSTCTDEKGFYQIDVPDVKHSYQVVFSDKNSKYINDTIYVDVAKGEYTKECNVQLKKQ